MTPNPSPKIHLRLRGETVSNSDERAELRDIKCSPKVHARFVAAKSTINLKTPFTIRNADALLTEALDALAEKRKMKL